MLINRGGDYDPNKSPRVGENNITHTAKEIPTGPTTKPSKTKTSATTTPSSIVEVTDFTDTTTDTTSDATTEAFTEPIVDVNTKRPTTRVDTSLEIDRQSAVTTTESSTDATETLTTATEQPTENTSTIRTTNNRTTIFNLMQTSCRTTNDCAANELCMNRRCLIKCDPKNNETNVNCAKGI